MSLIKKNFKPSNNESRLYELRFCFCEIDIYIYSHNLTFDIFIIPICVWMLGYSYEFFVIWRSKINICCLVNHIINNHKLLFSIKRWDDLVYIMIYLSVWKKITKSILTNQYLEMNMQHFSFFSFEQISQLYKVYARMQRMWLL